MSAAYQNLYLEQGTSYSVTITLDDVYGNNYDLNTYTAYSQLKSSYYSANATAAFATSLNPTTGTIILSMDSATSANIPPGRYVYDTIIRNTSNTTVRVLEGIVDVSPAVTIL
jgi:hypothetical protein